jgi:hypothetical protein
VIRCTARAFGPDPALKNLKHNGLTSVPSGFYKGDRLLQQRQAALPLALEKAKAGGF